MAKKNSFWLDYTFGEFYDLFGWYYNKWKKKKKKAPADEMLNWSLDQGIPIAVYIEKNGNWEFVDYFNIIGPMAERKDILPIDLSDIQSDTISFKLEYAPLFWEIDYVAMDFTPDLPVQQKTIPLESAIDGNGQDVTDLLNYDDDKYLDQSEIGNEVTLIFPASEIPNKMQRSIFLHSKDHYEILRNPRGIPNFFYLKSFNKPGKFVKFSNKLFLDIYNNYVVSSTSR